MGHRTTLALALTTACLWATSFAGSAIGASPSPGVATTPPPGRIVFSRWDDALGDFQAFTVGIDGTGETLVLPGAHEIPHWSPDGTSLVTTAVTAAGQVVPAIVSADGSGYRELPVEPGLNLGCVGWTRIKATCSARGGRTRTRRSTASGRSRRRTVAT